MSTTSRFSTRRRKVLAGVAVVTTAAASAAIATGAPSPDVNPTQPDVKAVTFPTVTEVPSELSSQFSVLRGAAKGGETFQTAADQSDRIVFGRVGANPNLARRVGDAARPATWLVPGDQQACIVAEGIDSRYPDARGTTCDTLAGIERTGLYLLAGEKGNADVRGILPDNVDSITVQFVDGTTTKVPVINNGYTFTTRGNYATSLSWSNSLGEKKSIDLGPLP